MIQILSHSQAQAVATAFSAVAAAGGRVTRITFMQEGGRRIKFKALREGALQVLRIDERGTVTQKRSYDGLAEFTAAHSEVS